MKTTIELPDDLALRARRCAAESHTTLRSLVEEALRRELQRRETPMAWSPDPTLRFGSGGLTSSAAHLTWSEIREMAMQPS